MILLSDNDILIKLVGCDLLHDFLHSLNASMQDIVITPQAKFSIRKYAKKMLSDDDVRQQLLAMMNSFAVIDAQNDDKVAHLSTFTGLDGGENLLILATADTTDGILLTGDKRCLKALINNQHDALIADLTQRLAQRVYCFEHILLLLIDKFGFEVIKGKVLNRCVQDCMLQAVFRNHSNESNVIQGLISYSQELSYMLVAIK